MSELGERIYKRARLTGEFRLSSGATSSEYFDKYLFESDPQLLREIAEELVSLLPDGVELLAGLELGGVPLAVAVSQVSGLPTVFVRKSAKTYGTCRLAEGGEVAGRRIAVIEDVVTSGGQVIEYCRQLRDRGADIAVVLCVIDREAGGQESLAGEDLQLRSLFTMSKLRDTAANDALHADDAALLDLVEAVRALPYGRPTDRTVEGMLRERRGTCSTKHSSSRAGSPNAFLRPSLRSCIASTRSIALAHKNCSALKSQQLSPRTASLTSIVISLLCSTDSAPRSTRRSLAPHGTVTRHFRSHAVQARTIQPATIPIWRSEREKEHCDPTVREPFIAVLTQADFGMDRSS